ncbi:MAG: S-adenosylmethionine:tRNA ribosyltransferase-isomerase [Bacteroidetes bacterium]|nr:S-adenosylmethionine:tRNA ribosyltransferase-isomerase [Bacteroidota bacterium]
MHPKNLLIREYSYTLPENRIAEFPKAERDHSKLLIYKNKLISEDIYLNIADHLPADSLLVFNNTKVIEARLLFQKPTGGVIEIFCLEPHAQYSDITMAMMQTKKVLWQCLVGGASKWKKGQVLEKKISFANTEIILEARYIEKQIDNFIIELSWQDDKTSFAEILHAAGAIPLPPYIKRKAEKEDAERYQTIYAKHDGSVAAPTAGLHFTEAVFSSLKEKKIRTDFVTLHVGAGTFKPVKAEVMEDHEMHAEYIDVPKAFIENLLHNPGKSIVSVGTTSMRTLESLYWLGVKTVLNPGIINDELLLSQWEVYELEKEKIPVNEALQSLINWLSQNKLDRLLTKTQIIIAPGYKIKIVKGLITNFHQPQSTLLLLVAAIAGEKWKKIYQYALENDFRFLSYGDGCLIWAQ